MKIEKLVTPIMHTNEALKIVTFIIWANYVVVLSIFDIRNGNTTMNGKITQNQHKLTIQGVKKFWYFSLLFLIIEKI